MPRYVGLRVNCMDARSAPSPVPESPEAARAEPLASPAAGDWLNLPEAVLTAVRLLQDGPKLASILSESAVGFLR